MPQPTYISRRKDRDGTFGIQIRITIFGGLKALLRYSLGTRHHREAIARASAYFVWLFAMTSPEEVDAQIDRIIKTAHGFIESGPAADDFSAQHRRHFLVTATRILDSWHANDPCPIAFANLYSRQTEFARALTALNEQVRHDFEMLGINAADPNYAKKPSTDAYAYFRDATGRVEEVVQTDMPPHYPSISDDFFDPGEAPLPRFDVGDIYAEERPAVAPAALSNAGRRAADPPTVERRMLSASTPSSGGDAPPGPLMSELLQLQLAELSEEVDGLRTADRDLVPYISFWIHILGDRPIAAYGRDDARRFCIACSNIPHQKGMKAQAPIARYEYARKHGWTGLKRLTSSTIDNRYFTAIRRIYTWSKEAEHFSGEPPKLEPMGRKLQGALERDAFSDAEVMRLFGAPSFTGHQQRNKKERGPFLHQDSVFWGYVILFLTGMRPGEIAQLDIDDIREFESILHLDLRPFDPAKGRVALGDMRSLKTGNASRLVPVHPTLVELGLLDRARRLKELGHTRLFPDWKYRVLPDGRVKHGDMLARDWQRRKAEVTHRANVSAYSGRHSMASLLDTLNLKDRDRDRVLGHSHPGVAGRYGRKGPLPKHVVDAFTATDTPIMQWLRETLVSARDRAEADRKLIEPWLKIKPSEANK